MRRLAFAAVLALAAAPSARAEPLDLDLAKLGAPDPDVWTTLGVATGAAQLAMESRQRFAVLSTETALALSSAILQPASTTGHLGFDVGLEVATVPVHSEAIGAAPPPPFSNRTWPTRATDPGRLYLPSIHVRKALPFSFEFGGRMIYLAQSSYFAAQGEAKWALNEGFRYVPDFAVRAAYTRLFGHEDWNLGSADLDLMVSKRWSLNGVTSLTPYLAGRFTWVYASSERLDFAPQASTGPLDVTTDASFPRFTSRFYRTTLGVRVTAYTVSMALEGTYLGSNTPSDDDYQGVEISSSFATAAKLGWEF